MNCLYSTLINVIVPCLSVVEMYQNVLVVHGTMKYIFAKAREVVHKQKWALYLCSPESYEP